jgi:Ca2+-binding RTX toxin-like protein
MARTPTRTRSGRLVLVAAAAAALALPATASADLGGKTCFGEPLTRKGTLHRDVIHGTPGNDVIDTYAGNDVVYGGGGRDLICTGKGHDLLVGGRGRDKLDGYRGNDVVVGDFMNSSEPGRRHDTVIGAAGNDILVGDVYNPKGGDATGTGNNHIQSGPGNDRSVGNAYTADGTAKGTGDDTIFGGWGRDILVGDARAPHRAIGTGEDFLRLDEQNDLGAADAMITRSGLASGGGNDEMSGYTGDDVLVGGSYAPRGKATGGGRDDIFGGKGGNDLLLGDSLARNGTRGGGRDELDGSRGNDLLVDDAMVLGHPRRIVGDGNADHLRGGKDNDRFITSGHDRCIGGKGHNIDLSKPPCARPSGIQERDPGRWPGSLLQALLGPFLR